MRARRERATPETAELFDQAVRERALAVVTLQDGPEWITFKSHFLERDNNRRFFVLDHQSEDGRSIPPVAAGHYIGISFRQRSRKVMFATVVEAKGHFMVDANTRIPAVRYRWPENVTELQRRSYYRTEIPAGTTILASAWVGGLAARTSAQNSPLALIHGQLSDLSCGGARILLSGGTPDWVEGQTLGIEIQLNDGQPPARVNAHFRGARPDEQGRAGMAVQFVGLEVLPDGGPTIKRIAQLVQRLHRLGIASGHTDWKTSFCPE